MRRHVTDNKKAIERILKPGEEHKDDIEMSGYRSSFIVRFGMTDGKFYLRVSGHR